mgnify:CR=1 FL=1
MIIEFLFLFLFSYIIPYYYIISYYLILQLCDEIEYIKNCKIYFYYNIPRLFINILTFSTSIFLKKNHILKNVLRKECKLQNKINTCKYKFKNMCKKRKRTTSERMNNVSIAISKKYKQK